MSIRIPEVRYEVNYPPPELTARMFRDFYPNPTPDEQEAFRETHPEAAKLLDMASKPATTTTAPVVTHAAPRTTAPASTAAFIEHPPTPSRYGGGNTGAPPVTATASAPDPQRSFTGMSPNLAKFAAAMKFQQYTLTSTPPSATAALTAPAVNTGQVSPMQAAIEQDQRAREIDAVSGREVAEKLNMSYSDVLREEGKIVPKAWFTTSNGNKYFHKEEVKAVARRLGR